MASRALARWQGSQADALNELVNAHHAVGGEGPGRRYATDQLNRALVLALAAQFQGFCRDLHSEAAAFVAASIEPADFRPLVSAALTQARLLDRGNAQSSSIGADFGRFDLKIWDAIYTMHLLNSGRRRKLDQLNAWRNAIAHEDFAFNEEKRLLTANTSVILRHIRAWWSACDQLAIAFDVAVASHLKGLVGRTPW